MGVTYGNPNTVNGRGLIFWVDASNADSYPGSGSTWYDLTPYGSDLTLANSPTYSTSSAGGEFTFNGTSQYAYTTTNASVLGNYKDWTVCVWCRLEEDTATLYTSTGRSGNYQKIVSKWYDYFLAVAGNVTTSNAIYSCTGRGGDGTATAHDCPDGGRETELVQDEWHFIVAQRDHLAGTVDTYLDGSSTLAHTINSSYTGASSVSLSLAVDYHNHDQYFAGKISQVMIFNRAISADEIDELFERDKTRHGVS